MTSIQRGTIVLTTLASVIVASMATTVGWALPGLHKTRTAMDNDRASIALNTEQHSNIEKLRNDLQAIQTKQTELNASIWNFSHEDDFFSFLTSAAKSSNVTISQPNIPDAAPTGSLITRPLGVTIKGSLPNTLAFIHQLETRAPLIGLQSLDIRPGDSASTVTVSLIAATLWI